MSGHAVAPGALSAHVREEIDRWVADHPDGSAEAMADPFAADAAGP